MRPPYFQRYNRTLHYDLCLFSVILFFYINVLYSAFILSRVLFVQLKKLVLVTGLYENIVIKMSGATTIFIPRKLTKLFSQFDHICYYVVFTLQSVRKCVLSLFNLSQLEKSRHTDWNCRKKICTWSKCPRVSSCCRARVFYGKLIIGERAFFLDSVIFIAYSSNPTGSCNQNAFEHIFSLKMGCEWKLRTRKGSST